MSVESMKSHSKRRLLAFLVVLVSFSCGVIASQIAVWLLGWPG
jgi:hypothetical protein